MAAEKINIEKFIELSVKFPALDVRSPGEYNHAHFPSAHSLPLFSDEERKIVGTAYKQQNRETAIKLGLDFFGPKMRKMVEEVEEIIITNKHKPESGEWQTDKGILVYCWRGGMRSAGVAWLLDLYGFKVYTLIGGYKSFRRWSLQQFEKKYKIKILGGYTGSGKTETLKKMRDLGETIIDLEGIAGHKGSAFGNIGLPLQPSQEMFENNLALELFYKRNLLHEPPALNSFWLEDESQRIGTINIPQSFWNSMRKSPIYFLEIPFEERLNHITEEYGRLNRSEVMGGIIRIKKRLGGLETKIAVQLLEEGNMKECFRILLTYYDKWYLKGLHNRDNLEGILNKFDCADVNPEDNARKLIRSKRIEYFA